MTQNALIRRWEQEIATFGETKAADFLRDGQRERGLMYGGRAVCQALRPLFLSRSSYDYLLEESALFRQALGRLWRDFLAKPDDFEDLQFSELEVDLMTMDVSAERPDTFGRLDGILMADNTIRFLEYNGESPGGLGYGDALGELFESFPFFPKLQAELGLERCSMLPKVVETYLNSWREWCRERKRPTPESPRVLILDHANAPTMGEFRLFQRAFEAAGCQVDIGSPEELTYGGDALKWREQGQGPGQNIDIVYRRLLTVDLLENPSGTKPLLDAIKTNRIFCANGFGAYFFAHKGLLALLSDPDRHPQDLSLAEKDALHRCLPWTRFADPNAQSLPPGGGDARPLRQIVLDGAKDLVLKPAADYGGREVTLGWKTSPDEWQRAWERACAGRFVVQARVPLGTVSCRWQKDGEIRRDDFRFDLAPYVLGGSLAEGLGVRLSQDELLNVAAGGGSAVPVFLAGQQDC